MSLVAAALLIIAGLFMLRGFLPALVWAAISAIGLSPLFNRRACRWPHHRHELVPLLTIVAVLLVFVIPIAMIAVPPFAGAHAAAQWFGVPSKI